MSIAPATESKRVRAASASSATTGAPRNALARIKAALTPTFLPNHYPALHGLRVLAIVLVVQLHATEALNVSHLVGFSTLNLWFGMDLFFFLSGFLIGSMLLVTPASGPRVDIRRFYIRRAFRIVPAYLVVLTIFVWMFPPSAIVRGNLWKEYLYLTNYVPPLPGVVLMPWAWSLALEEHFYLTVPLLVLVMRALSPRAQLLTLGCLWLSALGVRYWEYVAHGPWTYMRAFSTLYVQSHLRYDILVAGIFTACLQHYYSDRIRVALERWPIRLALMLLSLLGFALLIFTWPLQLTWLPYNLLCWGTLTSIAYAPLVVLVINRESQFSRFLSLEFFRRFATFGYGLYLIHVPVVHSLCLPIALQVEHRLHWAWPVLWVAMVAAALGVSAFLGYVVHVLIEKPSLRLRDRVSP